MKDGRTVVGVDTAKSVFQLYWVELETGKSMAAALGRVSKRLPTMVVDALREQWARVARLDEEVRGIERHLKLWHRDNAASRRVAEIPGVGLLCATASVAAMVDPAAFRSGREFAAWLGLTPRHVGTGGRMRVLGISKRGDRYLRTLLIHGARAAIVHGKASREWVLRLAGRRPPNVVVVALANKMARTIRALLAHNPGIPAKLCRPSCVSPDGERKHETGKEMTHQRIAQGRMK